MAPLPVQKDWLFYRGDTDQMPVVYRRANNPITSTDGWQVLMQVRKKVDGEIWLEKTEQDPSVSLSVEDDALLIHITLLPEDTQDWPLRRASGVWDLQTTDPSGVVRTLVWGTFGFQGDVSKAEA